MQRVFIEDFYGRSGKLKFKAGQVRNYSRQTWDQMASSLGRPLKDFTLSNAEAAERGAKASIKDTEERIVRRTLIPMSSNE